MNTEMDFNAKVVEASLFNFVVFIIFGDQIYCQPCFPQVSWCHSETAEQVRAEME